MIISHRLISNATVSVVQTAISGLVLFLLYRYVIVHLGPEQLGLWSVVLASTSVARLSDMGLTGSVIKFVARYRALEDDVQAADVVQTAAISTAVVMALLLLGVYPLLDYVLSLAVPAASMSQALKILPWAVFSLWLGSVGGVFQSGLDGCQRMDVRNILLIIGNILFLGATVWLVPHYGLVGLAVGQTVQAALLMLGSWLMLRRQLANLPPFPLHWSKDRFNEMFGYAVNFQIISVAYLLFDPAIKLLMSHFGGLSSAAFYEMASQFVIKLRALFIAASQALVPAVAALDESAQEGIRNLYLKVYGLLFFVAVPFFAAIFVSLPLVSRLWIGYVEIQFLNFGMVLAIGWGINTLMSPAYFINLGTGDVRSNSISHVAMAVINLFLGIILGRLYGGLGVAIGAMVALTFGGCLIIHLLHKKYEISLFALLPREHFFLTGSVVFSVLLALSMKQLQFDVECDYLGYIVTNGIYITLVGSVMWLHPYKIFLVEKMRQRK